MTTKEFIQYASERPELCEKISACIAIEEAYKIGLEQGVTDDIETFKAVMTETKSAMEALSENDLTNVTAAGSTTAEAATVIFGTISTLGAAAAACA